LRGIKGAFAGAFQHIPVDPHVQDSFGLRCLICSFFAISHPPERYDPTVWQPEPFPFSIVFIHFEVRLLGGYEFGRTGSILACTTPALFGLFSLVTLMAVNIIKNGQLPVITPPSNLGDLHLPKWKTGIKHGCNCPDQRQRAYRQNSEG
jgi:hypothetical protein